MWDHIRGDGDSVDAALRAARVMPREELVTELAGRVGQRRQFSRLAFAAALLVFVLGTFISFNGVALAASGKTVAQSHVKGNSAARDQYSTVKPIKPAKSDGVKPATATARVKGTSGTLPFTGFSLLGTVVIGLALVGLGFVLRRRESRE